MGITVKTKKARQNTLYTYYDLSIAVKNPRDSNNVYRDITISMFIKLTGKMGRGKISIT